MEPIEYRHMFDLEEHHWWFQSRLQITEQVFFSSVMPAFQERKPDLLDLGCGTGLFLQRRQADCRAIGLDFSADALPFWRRRGLLRVVRADAARLPMRDQCMDIVTAFDILEHVEHDQQVIHEVWRVLRPGGFFLATVPAHPRLWSRHDVSLHHFRRYTRATFERLFASRNWKTLRQSPSFAMILPIAATIRLAQHALPQASPKADTRLVSPWLNRIFIRAHRFEASWLAKYNLPFGLSLLTLRQKPTPSELS